MKKFLLLTVILTSCVISFGQTRINQVKSKGQLLNEQYCTGLFRTYDGTYFDLVNDDAALSAKGYRNILDWLEGRVAGLQVFVARNGERIPIMRGSRAGICVDELTVSPDFLNALSVNDIAMIKIIKGPFAGAINSPGGVVAIYTIKGDEGSDD